MEVTEPALWPVAGKVREIQHASKTSEVFYPGPFLMKKIGDCLMIIFALGVWNPEPFRFCIQDYSEEFLAGRRFRLGLHHIDVESLRAKQRHRELSLFTQMFGIGVPE